MSAPASIDYFGSDLVADYLSALGVEYVSINPGATLRGLHDSLLRRPAPTLISTLHEEIAVAVAHGYAKAARKPMAVAIHDHVGPLHAHMAIFNAWADDTPMLILGGSGPRDSEKRRPWIDWIHTAWPTSGPLRDSLKWDTEPASVEGLIPALSRAYRQTVSMPLGPVFVALDVALQEAPAARISDPKTPQPPIPPTADAEAIDRISTALLTAQRPLFIVDRAPRETMPHLVRLAEMVPAGVIDLGSRSAFPSTHWADQTDVRLEALAEADLVVLVEPRDTLWPLTVADEGRRELTSLIDPRASVMTIGFNATRSSFPVDRTAEVAGAFHVEGHAPSILESMAGAIAETPKPPARADRRRLLTERWRQGRELARRQAEEAAAQRPIHPAFLALTLARAVGDGPWQLANGLLEGWPRRLWDFDSEDSYLGRSGGEGLGYGLPASIGAALAHSDDDILVVDVQADGDMLYTPQALWTAAHHRIPLLVVVYDNRAYGRDLVHMRLVASERGRESIPGSVSIDHPAVGFTKLAEGFGVEARGPVDDPAKLLTVLTEAASAVRVERRPILVHVVCG